MMLVNFGNSVNIPVDKQIVAKCNRLYNLIRAEVEQRKERKLTLSEAKSLAIYKNLEYRSVEKASNCEVPACLLYLLTHVPSDGGLPALRMEAKQGRPKFKFIRYIFINESST